MDIRSLSHAYLNLFFIVNSDTSSCSNRLHSGVNSGAVCHLFLLLSAMKCLSSVAVATLAASAHCLSNSLPFFKLFCHDHYFPRFRKLQRHGYFSFMAALYEKQLRFCPHLKHSCLILRCGRN